jgi:sec-independent protein translocase protein TatA
MFGNIGPWELALVLLIALFIFGPGKLPEAGKAIGKAVNQFKQASTGMEDGLKQAVDPGTEEKETKTQA